MRDDAWTLYTPTTVLEDADKAAAIKEYVAAWAKAQQWISDNPDEFAEAYYVDHEGLSPEDAQYVVDALGTVHGADQTGTSSSPATRRPSTCSSRSRTRSRSTWRPLRPALREGDRGGGGGLMTTLTGNPAAPARSLAERRATYAPPGAGSAPASRSASAVCIGTAVLLVAWVRRLRDRPARPAHALRAVDGGRRPRGDLIENGRLQESLMTSGVRAALGLAPRRRRRHASSR